MVGRIIFVDNVDIPNLNHKDIKNRAIGASEYQFYNLIGEFSKLKLDIICYNKITDNKEIDGVTYKNIQTMKNDIFRISDKIIVQRVCQLIPLSVFETNEIFVWFHDKPDDFIIELSTSTVSCNESLFNLYKCKNIKFIFNSESTKDTYLRFFSERGIQFEPSRFEVIYNILYEDDFIEFKNKDFEIDKNVIVFGSAWMKGIDVIIQVFNYIFHRNDKIKLFVLTPGYDYHLWQEYKIYIENAFQDRIKIFGPLDKKSYCEIIRTSLCVLSPVAFETFGCIFAESYYLGTPVIADIRTGAVKEIIDNDYIVDYSIPENVLQKILFLQNNIENIKVKLDEKFLLEENMLLWKKFVLLSDLKTI
jgi:glycosyltransferase involved in cell wall biosynthesis